MAERFPAPGILVDACGLLRLHKCGALGLLGKINTVHVADQVHSEFSRRGAAQKAALAALSPTKHTVTPGNSYWDAFCRIRGSMLGTQDLGEQESIAVCVGEAQAGRLLPFVSYDRGAARIAVQNGVVVVDFLATLAWAVEVGAATAERADAIEDLAQSVNGWKRPPGYAGSIETCRAQLVAQTRTALLAAKPKRDRK